MAYFSCKIIDAERNYEIYYAELFAIGESFRHWRHYLEQPYHIVEVLTDHRNLCEFMSTNKLTRRQVRLALDLSAFDFRLVYRKGTSTLRTILHVDRTTKEMPSWKIR